MTKKTNATALAITARRYLSVDEAAVVFGCKPKALRMRIARHLRRHDGKPRALLGDGWVAVKLGGRWALRQDEASGAAA